MTAQNESTPGRPPQYRWNAIFDGKPKRLWAGEDFHVPAREFQNQLLAEARRRGLLARTSVGTRRTHDDLFEYKKEYVDVRLIKTGRHDWNRLLNGHSHVVELASLRTTTPQSFIRAARRAAAQRGVSLEIRKSDWALQLTAIHPLPFPVAESKDRRYRRGRRV